MSAQFYNILSDKYSKKTNSPVPVPVLAAVITDYFEISADKGYIYTKANLSALEGKMVQFLVYCYFHHQFIVCQHVSFSGVACEQLGKSLSGDCLCLKTKQNSSC